MIKLSTQGTIFHIEKSRLDAIAFRKPKRSHDIRRACWLCFLKDYSGGEKENTVSVCVCVGTGREGGEGCNTPGRKTSWRLLLQSWLNDEIHFHFCSQIISVGCLLFVTISMCF